MQYKLTQVFKGGDVARLLLPSLVGDIGIAEQDNSTTVVGDCGLPPTPLYKTAADERYLGIREG